MIKLILKTLSYPKVETAYQSCWLIVTKALVINRLSLKTLLTNLDETHHGVSILGSGGVIPELLLPSLNTRLRLSKLTLDQASLGLNFQPLHHGRRQSIRHCQECIDANYHSAIFLNPLIHSCPVHNKVLIHCSRCSNALYKGGSLFTQPLMKYGTCEHLRAFVEARVPMVTLSDQDVQEFERVGDEYQGWLDSIERLGLGAVSDVIPKISGPKDFELSQFYFEYVRRYAGLPFNLPWQSAPFPYEICSVNYISRSNVLDYRPTPIVTTDTAEHSGLARHIEINVDLVDVVKCVKSIRRYLHKAYITPHRKCFNAIRGLSHGQLNILSFTERCSCVSAYCAWLVSSGGVSTLPEHQSMRSNAPMLEVYSDLLAKSAVSLREILLTQLVSFFDVWGALEYESAHERTYSDTIISRALIANESFGCMNASYTLTRRDKIGGKNHKQKSYFISPRLLAARSRERCSCNQRTSFSKLVEIGRRNVYVPSSHGIMRFVDGRSDIRNTLVINIW
ncbi:hypothetical protein GIV49_19635 [Pseudomonas syringae]|uniref:hypothetical protein n=1 Tax=Pseudomonas syringae TaxID=317 RepID=UPI001F3A1DD7|nr:hypothetical protein [Pseudomonas syringae]MCF5651755.1 hypothetical protein [Pseudomonas syringae]